MEMLRESIDWFLREANDTLYGWRLRVSEFWGQGVSRWLLLCLAVLATLLVILLRRERKSRHEMSLLHYVSQRFAKTSSPEAMISLLFDVLFKAAPTSAACIYLASSPEGPFLLKGKHLDSVSSTLAQRDWDPEVHLKTIPMAPGATKKGDLVLYTIPVMVGGQPLALLELSTATWEEAKDIHGRVGFLISLLTPIFAQLVAIERLRAIEEQAREASVVSGSSQMLLSTTLGLNQLGELLLGLTARSTGSHAGLILLKNAASGRQGVQILASNSLESPLLHDLTEAIRERPITFLAEGATIERLSHASSVSSLLLRAGFRSFLHVPIMDDASPVGGITLLRRDGEFRQSHLRICQMNATRLALGLKNQAYHEVILGEYRETLKAVVRTLESSSLHLVEHHSGRVAWFAREMAEGLALSENETEGIWLAGELHDVGMIGLDDEILLKAGRLTSTEYDLVKHHPTIGAVMTAPIQLPIPIAPLILHHHERFDGFGYPSGLKGSEIPLGSRILTLGDVFDAMLTSRNYRQALTFSDAIARLQTLAGTQLDPKLVDLFVQRVTPEKWAAITREERSSPPSDSRKGLDNWHVRQV